LQYPPLMSRFASSMILAGALVVGSCALAAEPLFYIRDLSPLAASAFNDRGDFVGSLPGIGGGVWSKIGGLTPLRSPDGSVQGLAGPVDINNARQVIGSWFPDPTGGIPYAAFWSSPEAVPVLILGQAGASAINSRGVVLGGTGSATHTAPWLWQDGSLQFLPSLSPNLPSNPGATGYDINDTGTAVGRSAGEDYQSRAVLWRDGAIEDLGIPPYSTAYGINNAGAIVGGASQPGGEEEAFLWTADSGMANLGPGVANAINDHNWVIGYVVDQNGRPAAPFLWRPSAGRSDLASLVDLTGTGFSDLGSVSDINSSNQILGFWPVRRRPVPQLPSHAGARA